MNKKYEKFILGTRELSPPRGIQKTEIAIAHVTDINHYRFLNNDVTHPNFISNISGAGTGDIKENAMFLATMEAYERLANSVPNKRTIVTTAEKLGDLAIDLSSFPQVGDSEKNHYLKRPRKDEELRWSESYNLSDKKLCYIPQVYINLFSRFKYQGENITHPISTGCAIHQNFVDAIINGIYEVIERDAISLSWLLNLPLKKVSPKSIEENIEVFAHPFLGESTLYEASTVDGVYTFCLRARANYSEHIKNVLMYSTNTCPKKAIKKIKKELVSVMYSLVNAIPKQEKLLNQSYDLFYHVDEGALFMAHEKMDEKFSFLDKNGEIEFPESTRTFESNVEELDYLITTLKNQGHTIYVTDLTNVECEENGLRAVKVTIPSLQPISFVHGARYLKSDRLETVAQKLYGYYDEKLINPEPLPFS
ncbi:YcaO-like family protein [Solibacillus silvestris]